MVTRPRRAARRILRASSRLQYMWRVVRGPAAPLVPLSPEHWRVYAGNFLGKLNSPYDDVYDIPAHRASLKLRSSPNFLSLSLVASIDTEINKKTSGQNESR